MLTPLDRGATGPLRRPRVLRSTQGVHLHDRLRTRAVLAIGCAAVAASTAAPNAARAAHPRLVTAAWVGQSPDVLPRERRTRADIAVSTALSQIGKPYRYGGRGPESFDCSGLAGHSWAAAGVVIPRSSGAQYAGLPKVP